MSDRFERCRGGSLGRSAIDKRPVTGSVRAHRLGLDGDEIGDIENHGGIDQAVYAFGTEDLEEWSDATGRQFNAGHFGENLTTRGIDLNAARIGDRWRVGTAVLEVSTVRTPCATFQGFLGEPHWVKRFTQRGRPGAYLRVVEAGDLGAGDPIEVIERRPHDLTIGLLFRAVMGERELLPQFLAEPRICATTRKVTEKYVSATNR